MSSLSLSLSLPICLCLCVCLCLCICLCLVSVSVSLSYLRCVLCECGLVCVCLFLCGCQILWWYVLRVSVCMCVCVGVYIYIYISTYMYTYVYWCTYIHVCLYAKFACLGRIGQFCNVLKTDGTRDLPRTLSSRSHKLLNALYFTPSVYIYIYSEVLYICTNAFLIIYIVRNGVCDRSQKNTVITMKIWIQLSRWKQFVTDHACCRVRYNADLHI